MSDVVRIVSTEQKNLSFLTGQPAMNGEPNLQPRLETISEKLVKVSQMVESAVERSITALLKQDHHLAEAVICEDEKIDEAEVDLEHYCIETLELWPTGEELREVVAVLR